ALGKIDAKDALWAGLSFDKTMQGRLSRRQTKRERDQRGDAALCCYHWTLTCAGRPMVVDGRPVLAELDVEGTHPDLGWHTDLSPEPTHLAELPETLRASIAEGWLEDARLE